MIDFTNVKSITYGGNEVKQVSLNGDILWEKKLDTLPYLCFTAEKAGSTVQMLAHGVGPSVSLEYSTDKQTWNPFVVSQTTVTLANIGDKVYLRGNNRSFASSALKRNSFHMTGTLAASGNIMSIFDETMESKSFSASYACYFMFKDCASLTKAPDLPATTLSAYCYTAMFDGCTALRETPYLPNPIASSNYGSMFRSCSSLNKVTVGFTSWENVTTDWLSGVAPSGVFYCPSALEEIRGASNIPNGWTIVRTD